MQRPSYPKETADQWPAIAGDHTGWGGACNQSINTGRSLGERYNLMRHTPTHLPPYLTSSSSGPSPSSRNLFFFFFSYSVCFCPAPITNKQSCTSRSPYFPPSLLPHPPTSPNDISEIPRGREAQKGGMPPGWSRGRWGGRRWRQAKRGRLMGTVDT